MSDNQQKYTLRSEAVELLIDCWSQFSIEVEIDGETWHSDGALSTLEDLADYLVEVGHLIRHPSRDVYRVKT